MKYPIMLRNTILIKITKQEKDGAVHLPETVQKERSISAIAGEAVSVGDDCKVVTEGDFLFYKSYVGNALEHKLLPKDEILIVVSEDDVVGILPRGGDKNDK
jgi:co-chaperonin GroES (HSP10)